jgi:SagB-type dehydrogenase family enzyme
MNDAFYRLTELDRTTWPEIRDQVMRFTHDEPLGQPRRYPGFPCWPLLRSRGKLWPPLERALNSRRSERALATQQPTKAQLSRLLQFSHGVNASLGRGPTPSAGSLQALELYLVTWAEGWLPKGLYHYDRGEHVVTQLHEYADRADWLTCVPSLALVEGGALLWLLVGDGERITKKYGARGLRFLLLEAGHLMQNLCLMSWRVGCTTVPLGGFFEQDVARRVTLPASDAVLYVGVCGAS